MIPFQYWYKPTIKGANDDLDDEICDVNSASMSDFSLEAVMILETLIANGDQPKGQTEKVEAGKEQD